MAERVSVSLRALSLSKCRTVEVTEESLDEFVAMSDRLSESPLVYPTVDRKPCRALLDRETSHVADLGDAAKRSLSFLRERMERGRMLAWVARAGA